jgi:hypothetical protein
MFIKVYVSNNLLHTYVRVTFWLHNFLLQIMYSQHHARQYKTVKLHQYIFNLIHFIRKHRFDLSWCCPYLLYFKQTNYISNAHNPTATLIYRTLRTKMTELKIIDFWFMQKKCVHLGIICVTWQIESIRDYNTMILSLL